ncbi:TetR/AcrR family transcriptional regulator [Amnibacterium soli]|uniref:TetR/AcrR family transcriptional regulator n=1 Tax=Amnibacterium soli TaxID=1282736 RepID=A0ABP8ZGS0_9MICO
MGDGLSAALRPAPEGRREAVLDAALETFARFGYRKTSMDDVAADARISRPGLYFLFSSKGALFRAAIERAIELDLAMAQRALAAPDRPLVDRVVEAFDHWAGRYVGPMGDVQALVSDNPGLLGPVAAAGPDRFQRMLDDALRAEVRDPEAVVRTLISVSVGVKHQVADRVEYLERLRTAAALLLDPLGCRASRD